MARGGVGYRPPRRAVAVRRARSRQRAQRIVLALLPWLVTIATLLAGPAPAAAHANLDRSTPNANAVLPEQPRQTFLFFSEEPELRLTELRLLDPTGRLIGPLAARPAPGDPRAVTANLPDLAPGTYLIAWRTTSAVDGHTTRGAFPFTYGINQVPVAVTVHGIEATTLYVPSTASVVARFLTFTGAFGLVGGLAFGPLVLWPAAAGLPRARRRPTSGDDPADALDRAARRALLLIGLYALPALAVGTVLAALTQAAEAADVPLTAVLGEPLGRAMVGTRHGVIYGARLLCALGLALALALALRWPRHLAPSAAALALGGGFLLTLSLGSHAAAAPRLTPLVVALDVLHLAAAAVWVGGLVQLCLVAAGLASSAGATAAALPKLVARFAVMVNAVAVVVLTGLLQTAINAGGLAPLWTTPYGQTLLVKIGLVAAMGALGLLHWRRVGPRLGRASAAALTQLAGRFRWTAFAEAMLGMLVLAATGLLTAQQPARDAAIALRHVSAAARADDLALTLDVAPGEAGLNRIGLRVSGPLAGLEKVVLRLTHLDMDMGEQEVDLRQTGSGMFVAEGGQFSMAGRWHVEPLVRRTGRDDARVLLTVPIAEPLGSTGAESPPFELTPRMVLGIEAAIFGLILIVAARQLRRRSVQASWSALLGGVGAIVVGAYVTADAVAAENASPARLRSPIAVDADALARGRVLYQQNCLSCHGVAGRGDGPIGRALNPRPADLRIHVTQHAEGQLFAWITDGMAGTPMPAFRDVLLADDRWRLVAFIKGFAEDGPAPAQTAVATMLAPGAPAKPAPAGSLRGGAP